MSWETTIHLQRCFFKETEEMLAAEGEFHCDLEVGLLTPFEAIEMEAGINQILLGAHTIE